MSPHTPTWVYFVSGMKESWPEQFDNRDIQDTSRFHVRYVNPVKGANKSNISRCTNIIRIEASAPLLQVIDSSLILFQGVTQHLQYTDDSQLQELNKRSISELKPSEHTTAVLIPIGKSEDWWNLAQNQRQAHFNKSGTGVGHTAIGLEYADRVFRKLYHSRYLNVFDYDFLTYFEFKDIHEKDFRNLLAELRDTKEWAFVDFELEIWMEKTG